MAFMKAGDDLLKRVSEEVSEIGTVDQPPAREARNRMTMVIVPK
jgi:translation initiation factor IF-3